MQSTYSYAGSSSSEEGDRKRSFNPRHSSANLSPQPDGSGNVSLPTEDNEASKVLQPNFVVLGRGRGYQRHSGNVAFAALINANAARYSSAALEIKKSIVREILSKVYDKGGGFRRFEKHTNLYVPVDHETARQKVMHAIQHVIRQSDSTKHDSGQQQTIEHSTQHVKQTDPDDEFFDFSHLDDEIDHLFQECGEESWKGWLPPEE